VEAAADHEDAEANFRPDIMRAGRDAARAPTTPAISELACRTLTPRRFGVPSL